MAKQTSAGGDTHREGAVRGGASSRGAGERQDDDDAPVDVFQWVAKTRVGTSTQEGDGEGKTMEKKDKQQRAGGRRQTPKKQHVVSGEEEQPKIKEHAMVAMKDIGGGEEMILTLEDRGVLDEEGEDVLENVREAELKRNAHGRMRAEKAKPLWEEDGVQRGLLDKYDEEEEEATYMLGGGGGEGERDGLHLGSDADPGKGRQGTGSGLGSVKARLEEAKMSLLGAGGDYYTAEEMAKGKKKKGAGEEVGLKRRKTKAERKQRRLKKALTADEIAEMEVAVDSGDGGDGGDGKVARAGSRHVGSREEREEREAARKATELAAAETARGKFDAALARANVKSERLRADRPGELGAEEAEEEMLAASMAKARTVALNSKLGSNLGRGSSVEDVAKLAIARREKAKEAVKVEDGLTFTDVGEFARSIATRDGLKYDEEDGGDADKRDEEKDAECMDVDVDVKEEIEKAEKKGRKRYRKHGGNQDDVMVAGVGGVHSGDSHAMDASNPDPAVAPSAAEKDKLGPGLGSILSLLKDRGDLNKPVEWGGRANDFRNSFFTNAMGGFSDVFSGGRADDELAANVEVALTRKDEFGRVLTPKEAFRQFCHSFHGIQPSQNSKEKRIRQAQKELAQKQRNAGASSGPGSTKQAKRDTPFVSLDGKIVKPGQRRE